MPIDQIIDDLLKHTQVRAKSMVVTVFGDSIVPRGGEVWLADLIQLMAPFGINDRMVRTAVYRLTQDGYFRTVKQGRKSLYLLTEEGARIFAVAERRIYATGPPSDAPGWTVLYLTAGLSAKSRKDLVKLLGWQGFAEIAPNVFASCTVEIVELRQTLDSVGAEDTVASFLATPMVEREGAPAIRSLVQEAWPLADLASQYLEFRTLLKPIAALLQGPVPPSPEQAFMLRSLAVHAYRRLLLRHPSLPASLLPGDWPGSMAMEMYEAVYGGLLPASEHHLSAFMEGGASPAANPQFASRFDGRLRSVAGLS